MLQNEYFCFAQISEKEQKETHCTKGKGEGKTIEAMEKADSFSIQLARQRVEEKHWRCRTDCITIISSLIGQHMDRNSMRTKNIEPKNI